MTLVEQYRAVVDILRDNRRSATWRHEKDRDLVRWLEHLFARLSVADQVIVRAEEWRSWPVKYDREMKLRSR